MPEKKPKSHQSAYLAEESAEMLKQGYVTVKAASDEAGVNVHRVYRAIKAQKVRVKLGANEYNRYVHRGDWLKFIQQRRQEVMHNLGVG